MRGAFPIQIFPSQAKCLLYQIMEKVLLPLFLFLHSLRQRKNPTRMFQQMVRHNHIGYGGRAYVFVWGLARSSYVAQIRCAHPYLIGIFRQSQAPTVLSNFRKKFHS